MVDEIRLHEIRVHLLKAFPEQVDAGTDVLWQVQVSCPEKCNLLGGMVRIVDEEGTVVQEVDLASFDGEANETEEFSVQAPAKPGSYTWAALFVPYQAEEVQHEPGSAPIPFTVKPHVITVSVWGVPLPVRKGEEFTVKIGAKCSANCSLAGLAFAVHDHQGNPATRGELGDELLPMTSDLRWSEQKLVAPAEAGLYKWVVECPAPGLELPHEVPSASFTFKAVDPPDHVVTVEVIDRDRKTLLKNASIFMHPYRGNTDEQGIGRIEIGKGQHELYVKKQDYVPFQTTVQVDEDVTVRVELMWSPDPYVF